MGLKSVGFSEVTDFVVISECNVKLLQFSNNHVNIMLNILNNEYVAKMLFSLKNWHPVSKA